MSYKPDEKDWMAYLYGELEEEDRQKIDRYILENEEGRNTLEKYQYLRRMLSVATDKEVIAPPFFIDANNGGKHNGGYHFLWNNPYFKTVASIAASVLLILLAGKLTGSELVVSNHELRLSFGLHRSEAVARPQQIVSLSGEQVQEMINTSLETNNQAMHLSVTETQKQLDASIRTNLALNSRKINQLVQEASTASQQQIQQFVAGIKSENIQQVKDYFQLTSTDQKKYIENLLVDFAKYLQQQRTNDLQLVQTRMSSLEQNTNIFKHETEQILSSIITTVGGPNQGETKN
jgi:hypothetical protein